MMDPNAANRPTAAQLLDFELFTGDLKNSVSCICFASLCIDNSCDMLQHPQQHQEQEDHNNDESFAFLKRQLKAKSRALDQQNEEMAALRLRMERIELEKKLEMDAMQKQLEDLQRQLSQVQQSSKLPLTPPASSNMDPATTNDTSTASQ